MAILLHTPDQRKSRRRPAASATREEHVRTLRPRNETLSSTAIAASMAAVFLLCSTHAGFSAEQWNFYMHQSAPNFATSRGAKLFTEEIEKATNGELKVRLHLSG